MSTANCPPTEHLGRALSGVEDAGFWSHVDECARCRAEIAAFKRTIDLAREIPLVELSAAQRAATRSKLLIGASALASSDRTRRPVERARWLLALAAAALCVVLGLFIQRRMVTESEIQRATLHHEGGARFARMGNQPDEIVRLYSGTISVEVERLQNGERFRVIVGDAEVEVRGTAFDVVADHDKLTAVRVIHGRVEVRQGDNPMVVLNAGDRWAPAGMAAQVVAAPPDEATGRAEPSATGSAAGARAPVVARATPEPRASSADPAAVHGARSAAAELELASAASAANVVSSAQAITSGSAAVRSMSPSAAEIAFQEGVAALRAGDLGKAEAAFARVPRDASVGEDAAFLRGVAIARSGRTQSGVAALSRFVEGFPESPRRAEASVALGWLLLKQGKNEGAARAFRVGASSSDQKVRRSAADGLSRATKNAAP